MGAVKFRNRWGVDISYNGKRIRKTSPENSRAGARAYETLIRHQLASGRTVAEIFNTEPQEPREDEQTFETFAWHWFDIYVQPNNKFSEQQRKKRCLNANLLPFFGSTPLGRINTYQIEQYKAHETRQGMHPKTINNHLSVLIVWWVQFGERKD